MGKLLEAVKGLWVRRTLKYTYEKNAEERSREGKKGKYLQRAANTRQAGRMCFAASWYLKETGDNHLPLTRGGSRGSERQVTYPRPQSKRAELGYKGRSVGFQSPNQFSYYVRYT